MNAIIAENLQQFIEDNNTEVVMQTLSEMTEKDRHALQDSALKAIAHFWKQAAEQINKTFEYREEFPEIFALELNQVQHFKQVNHQTIEAIESAKVAVLYCCDFVALKEAGSKGLPAPSHAYRILSHRQPKWLNKWATYAFDYAPRLQWKTVVDLENAGLVQVKHKPSYYETLAIGLSSVDDMAKYISETAILKNEFFDFITLPATLKAIGTPVKCVNDMWFRNFMTSNKFPNGSFSALAVTNSLLQQSQTPENQSFDAEQHTKRWLECISNLASQEIIDRNRLINLSFQLLTSSAEQPEKRQLRYATDESVALFLCSLNSVLCPEKSKFITSYLPLVGAANKYISRYAIKIFLDLEHKVIPVEELCQSLAQTFRNSDAEPSLLSLKLIERLISQSDKTADKKKELVTLALIEAFSSKSKAVHNQALELLSKHQLLETESARAKLLKNLDLLQGTNRSTASKLLASASTQITASLPNDKKLPLELEVRELIPPAINEDLDEHLSQLAGIASITSSNTRMSANELAQLINAPVDLFSTESPRLNANERITPITELEDLIFLTSASLTNQQTPEKMEILLDGISRLWQVQTHDFESKIRNAQTRLQDVARYGLGTNGLSFAVPIQVWLYGPQNDNIEVWFIPTLFSARCFGLAARMRAKLSLPLLAAPTHKSGWVEPMALVERVKIWQSAGRLLSHSGNYSGWTDPNKFQTWLAETQTNAFHADAPEFIQALLRLAPEGRKSALIEAQDIKGDFGKSIRFALGEGGIDTIERPELALAAFRSRFPRDICITEADKIPNLPDGIEPAKYKFNPAAVEETAKDHYRIIATILPDFLSSEIDGKINFPVSTEFARSSWIADHIQINFEQSRYHLYATVALHSNLINHYSTEYCLIWLQNRESLLARLSKILLLTINSISAFNPDDFSLFFDRDLPLSENGSWWLSLVLVAKNDDLRRFGLDILIAAVEENRVSAYGLGRSMSLLNGFTQIRWIKALRELAKVSALHAAFSWEVLTSYVLNKRTDTPLGFLELMLELAEEHGFGLSAEVVQTLEQFNGSGKTAKLARSLAAEKSHWKSYTSLNEATKQSLQSRAARVKRWQEGVLVDR